MISAVCGGIRVVCVYAPNGRVVGLAVLPGQAGLVRSARAAGRGPRARRADGARRRLQRRARPTPTCGTPPACHGGTHVSPPEREAFAAVRLGPDGRVSAAPSRAGRYTWWDYRAGNFHKNFGMRIDHLLVTRPLALRTVASEIDREARKGRPIPSDHAPLVIDLDEAGHPFDAGWTAAESRIAAAVRAAPSPVRHDSEHLVFTSATDPQFLTYSTNAPRGVAWALVTRVPFLVDQGESLRVAARGMPCAG